MTALATRARSATGAGTVAALVLVLIFGNQAYTEWAAKHASGHNAWDLFLRTLAWPKWSLTSGTDTPRTVIANDLRALLLVVFVAVLLGLATSSFTGWAGGFFLGWFAAILGGALAALLTVFITADASLYGALLAAAEACAFGLFVGWIVGVAAGSGHRG